MITNIKEFIDDIIREEFEWDKEKVAGKEITPPRYVYHISDKSNRNKILQQGLKPMVGDSYKDWTKTDKSVPAIFATKGNEIEDITGGLNDFQGDIWKIDTTSNKWFVDKHFEIFNKWGLSNPHIVTFQPISKNNLRLVYKQS